MSHEILLRQLQLESEDATFALVEVMKTQGPTAVKSGNKALILSDGAIEGWVGGHCTEAKILEAARDSMKDGETRVLELTTCHGGRMDVFIEPNLPRRKLLVFGHVPIVPALLRFARLLNFSTAVYDKLATKAKFPQADSIFTSIDQLKTLRISSDTYSVIATMGEGDQDFAEFMVESDSHYVGIVSGKKRAGEIIKYLEGRNVQKRQLAKVRAPAGIFIGAVSAEEIALSIMAEIVETARMENKGITKYLESRRVSPTKVMGEMSNRAYSGIDPVCKMTVGPSTEYAMKFEGNDVLFCSRSCKDAFTSNPSKYLFESSKEKRRA